MFSALSFTWYGYFQFFCPHLSFEILFSLQCHIALVTNLSIFTQRVHYRTPSCSVWEILFKNILNNVDCKSYTFLQYTFCINNAPFSRFLFAINQWQPSCTSCGYKFSFLSDGHIDARLVTWHRPDTHTVNHEGSYWNTANRALHCNLYISEQIVPANYCTVPAMWWCRHRSFMVVLYSWWPVLMAGIGDNMPGCLTS